MRLLASLLVRLFEGPPRIGHREVVDAWVEVVDGEMRIAQGPDHGAGGGG